RADAALVGDWRDADQLPEAGAERAEAGEPDIEAGLRDGAAGAQRRLGPLDAPPRQILMRRLAKCVPEYAQQVVRRDAGDASQLTQVRPVLQLVAEALPRDAQAPEEIAVDQHARI